MNLVQSRTLHPHLRDEEARVVENAVRLAIDSIINVLFGVDSARTHEYQRMVGDRDKEIQRLERRLREIEHEVRLLRRQGCTCGLLGGIRGLDSRSNAGAQSCMDREIKGQIGLEPDRSDTEGPEGPEGQQECGMNVSLCVFARPPSHVSSQSPESHLPSSPSRAGLDQTCTSHSSQASAVSEPVPLSPGGLQVKEEPCDIDTVLIKWELSEERLDQEPRGSPPPDREGPSVEKNQDNGEMNQLEERPQAEAGSRRITEGEQLRNKKKSVPMSELPEEAQRLKRAAWRAASRRYYARKVARQQADPSRSIPFPHVEAPQYSPPISFADKRRRTLISELPEESQMLQREAWRAASRRYYARKVARHRTDPSQFGH